MDAFATGEAMSDRLRFEVQSDQWCKIDDTWADATHRDVSRDVSRATRVTLAWMVATLRLGWNLQLWDRIDTPGRARFDGMFGRWKPIGRTVPR